jgi:hypothetical protein
MDMSMNLNEIRIILDYLVIFFGFLFVFIGMIGVFSSIFLYITFPKKLKEEFFETSPDKTIRWAWDSYMAYYAFPGMVSMVTVMKMAKKVYSNHYDFNEKLSKRRLLFFRFHFYILVVGSISFFLGLLFLGIFEALEYFNLIQPI